jgi:hypothetical protein
MAECRTRYAGIMRERKRASRTTMELAFLRNLGDSARSEDDPHYVQTLSMPPTT